MNTDEWGFLLCSFGPPIVILTAFLFARFALRLVTVNHFSMMPTLKHGDRVLVFRYWPARWLRKGQIVLLRLERTHDSHVSEQVPACIKRVTGLPGETIVLNENVHHPGQTTWRVPLKHFFVLADSGGNAADSRLWGPVPFKALMGIVILTLSEQGRRSRTL